MKNIFLLFVSAVLLFSCNLSNEQKIEDEISEIVKEMKTSNQLDPEKISTLIGLYGDYVTQFPQSEKAPKYLEMQAKYLTAINHFEQAIDIYQKIIDEYPNYDKVSEALFMQAFTYEVNLVNLPKAEVLYKRYIELYPQGDFADDAKYSIENLYLTPEQLLEKLLAQPQDEVAEN